jgi:predicted NodU family carbamoyl transferase
MAFLAPRLQAPPKYGDVYHEWSVCHFEEEKTMNVMALKKKALTTINGAAESHGSTGQQEEAGSPAKPHVGFTVKAAGINKSHCASFCLVNEAGQPIFCASEERFTRVKLQRGMPYQTYKCAAQHFCLGDAKLAIGRLDAKRRLAREFDYYRTSNRLGRYSWPKTDRIVNFAKQVYLKARNKNPADVRYSQDTREFTGRSLDYGFDHHSCHMASAYYCSGFDEAELFTVDGLGDGLSATYGLGKGDHMEMRHKYFQSERIEGQSYEVVTAMLGFDPDRHPGKVTGLAAYAKPENELIAELDEWFAEQFKKGAKENWFYLIHQQGKEGKNIQDLRKLRAARFGKWSREQIASAIQFMLERDVIDLIRRHVPDPKGKNIALAGGCVANVKLNQRIKDLGFANIFIQPAMGDEGTGLGAAILAAHAQKPFRPYALHDVYLGPEYSREEIRRELESAGLEYQEITGRGWPLEQRLATLLHQGFIIARFQGRMEFGPRALGNRSIMYHAKDPTVNDWLNKQLKRSEFMPFAPVTLYGMAEKCYENLEGARHPAEFMTMTFDVTEEMLASSPACVHVDGTARPQLIREEVNPSYYWTLKYYHDLSGIPSLINTSFNMHEEPIVCTVSDAISAYLASELDALAIGDFLVINKNRSRR